MVLQDKYARRQANRWRKNNATELSEEDAALQAALDEAEKRRLGSNADRYKDDDDELARASGAAGPDGGPHVEEEVDEEEEARKAAELAELDAFRDKQRELLAKGSMEKEEDEDDDDVDHSFAHLRIGGSKGMGVPRPDRREEDSEELRVMQDEARRTQAVRDIKERFAGGARPLPPSTTSSSSSRRPFELPPKPGVKPAKTGQDFLDTLL
ncbi:hypothetical protein JCM10207_000991 [Rhodosporidiobolus poonsookiae]